MNAFEIVTSCLAGAVLGVAICAVARWRHIGGGLALAFGAIGGLVGGAGAQTWFPAGPTWGTMKYHPLALVLGAVGGIVVVLIVRLVWGPNVAPRKQRPGTT
jgi:hypothetical protein